MWSTIQEIKLANKEIGNHWFSKDTMSFFNSKIESEVLKGKYFITSEQFNTDAPRLYSIRVADDAGRINTVGEFQAYRTKAKALKYIEEECD